MSVHSTKYAYLRLSTEYYILYLCYRTKHNYKWMQRMWVRFYAIFSVILHFSMAIFSMWFCGFSLCYWILYFVCVVTLCSFQFSLQLPKNEKNYPVCLSKTRERKTRKNENIATNYELKECKCAEVSSCWPKHQCYTDRCKIKAVEKLMGKNIFSVTNEILSQFNGQIQDKKKITCIRRLHCIENMCMNFGRTSRCEVLLWKGRWTE